MTNPDISKSGKCQAIRMSSRLFKHVEEQNRKMFGYSYIVLKDGKLVAVP